MQNENASNRAYRLIKEMIIQYQWIPGQKITYQELTQKVSMSKTPIINALNRLEQEGFLESIANRGFFVKEIGIEEVSELFQVREALELLSVEGAIKNRDVKKLGDLEKAMKIHRETGYNTPATTRFRWGLDVSFHLKIAEMAGNKNLAKFLRHFCELIYLRHRIEGIPLKRFSETANEHLLIFRAIEKRSLSKAKTYMRKHLNAGRISTIEGIQVGKIGTYENIFPQ